MKIIRLATIMENQGIVYLARRWGKWYYIDSNGYWNDVKDVIVSLEKK